MELKVDLTFDQLLQLIMQLPARQRDQLKDALLRADVGKSEALGLDELLLSGPTFTKTQLKRIARTRKAMNKWRGK